MKTCIITGASSGIGKAVAIDLSNIKQFANIVLIGRNKKTLESTIASMNTLNKNIIAYEQDLSLLEGIPKLIEDIFEKCNSIDCLLNIAGHTDPHPLLNIKLESFQETYNVNVFAPILLVRECVKYMKFLNGAKILNIASTAGITPRPGWLSYASSKAALISISQTLTEELAEYKIKVYCVSPGRCATNLRKKLMPDEDPTTIMQPYEVSEIICNLISENEKCLDGQNIIIKKR